MLPGALQIWPCHCQCTGVRHQATHVAWPCVADLHTAAPSSRCSSYCETHGHDGLTCRRCVSLELRWGTCGDLAARAEKTSARALRLLLIRQASLARCPSTPDLASRSLQNPNTSCHYLLGLNQGGSGCIPQSKQGGKQLKSGCRGHGPMAADLSQPANVPT